MSEDSSISAMIELRNNDQFTYFATEKLHRNYVSTSEKKNLKRNKYFIGLLK